ncbi:MAG: M23 family metallopeptidase [Elusimicrobiota bacterium]|nr:M23 family metallopeptidase [Endomicrobiia bacterium]MDW8164887.1 M23 family metallopeptidase [Elusimicrobiota bacterium]
MKMLIFLILPIFTFSCGYKNCLDIIYNLNLYLFNIENPITEPYIDTIRYQIIKNIKPLVIIKIKYNYNTTLHDLAQSLGTDVPSIRSTNYIEALGLLYPGRTLLVHNKKGMLYKVKEDKIDMFSLSKKFNKSVEELCLANNLSPFHQLNKNDLIYLPNKYIKFKDFMLPISNPKITSGFGLRLHPIFGILKYHEGIDLKQRYGAPVRAACDGKVIFAGWAEGYGKLVILKHHKGYTTYYGHLSKIRVKVGQWVNKGQIIGNVGNTGWTTGPHLHFEIRKNGIPVNPKKLIF